MEPTKLTKDQTRRVLEVIEDCDRFIAKEGPRAADLRPAEVARVLAHAHSHKAKMQRWLAAGVWGIS